jgi:hypothetical protein
LQDVRSPTLDCLAKAVQRVEHRVSCDQNRRPCAHVGKRIDALRSEKFIGEHRPEQRDDLQQRLTRANASAVPAAPAKQSPEGLPHGLSGDVPKGNLVSLMAALTTWASGKHECACRCCQMARRTRGSCRTSQPSKSAMARAPASFGPTEYG